ncbi:MAG TPA: hypothetical protein GXX69_10580 [Firmicutes bacterium]|nr:hypothetical protein [Bacillota bacterium]
MANRQGQNQSQTGNDITELIARFADKTENILKYRNAYFKISTVEIKPESDRYGYNDKKEKRDQ